MIAEEAIETLLPLAEQRQITLDVTGEKAQTLGSTALMLRMVTNLVQNAVVHNLSVGGTVTVRTESQHDASVLRVENTGHRVPSELIPTLTEPFQRRVSGVGRHRFVTGFADIFSRRAEAKKTGRTVGKPPDGTAEEPIARARSSLARSSSSALLMPCGHLPPVTAEMTGEPRLVPQPEGKPADRCRGRRRNIPRGSRGDRGRTAECRLGGHPGERAYTQQVTAKGPDPLSEAAARRHELTRSKAVQALRDLDRTGQPVTFASVAQAAGISRSWLYTQPDISSQIRRLRESTAGAIPASQRATDMSLRARLTAVLDRNRQLADENARLRRQLAHALGDQRSARTRSGNDQQG